MNCKCLEITLKKISEALKPKNDVLDFKVDWKGSVFRFDGGCGVGLYVEWEYRNIKKDKTPYSNLTKGDNFIAMTFCPFCGTKIKEKKDE